MTTTITTLDTTWTGKPRSIAAALLESDHYCALIDPGPESTLPTLREQLRSIDLAVADLDAILLTHIHLDHAGATGSLVRENPNLTVYVHKNGAPHMIDPSKLLASAGRLWGDRLQVLFGNTEPVPPENLYILEGGEILTLGERKLDVAYTPGHASHHVTYFDDATKVAFIGDTGGIRMENKPFILPATPPPDIDLPLWDASINAILDRRPARLFLTHYGFADDPVMHFGNYRERLHRWANIAEEALSTSPDDKAASDAFVAKCRAEMDEKLGVEEAGHYAFTAALDLSFLGLARYHRKRAKAKEATT
jgi:glyoxylase-like metal-dependent hydrolase (beta-lactamase superfamily II)